jgi:hypothetical protein
MIFAEHDGDHAGEVADVQEPAVSTSPPARHSERPDTPVPPAG